MKYYDLYIDNMPQGNDTLAKNAKSAARKLGLEDFNEIPGKDAVYLDKDGQHLEVFCEDN